MIQPRRNILLPAFKEAQKKETKEHIILVSELFYGPTKEVLPKTKFM